MNHSLLRTVLTLCAILRSVPSLAYRPLIIEDAALGGTISRSIDVSATTGVFIASPFRSVGE